MGELTVGDARRVFDELSNWGRWGKDDERGALNTITPEVRKAAAALIQDGIAVSCARDLATKPGPDNPNPTQHMVIHGGDARPAMLPEPVTIMSDYFAIAPHGLATTHLDALCHIAVAGKIFNGFDASEVKTSGAWRDSVMAGSDGIVSRGVLMDIPGALGLPYLDKQYAVTRANLEEAERRQGVTVGPGDILAVYTGRDAYNAANPRTTISRFDALAGLHPECLAFLRERDISVLGCDGISDAIPTAIKGWTMPVHQVALASMGVHLIDNMELSRLADACRERNRYAFHLTLAPLRLVRGTASPVNPIALF